MLVLLLAPIYLTNCAAVTSKPLPTVNACDSLPLQTYSRTDQTEVAIELNKAPANYIWPNWLADYSKLRNAVRACQGIK